MRLVFIYGPPASGKTTIGRILARETGFSFFFNHATVPAARAIFPDRHNPAYQERYEHLLQRLRIDGIAAAAEASLDTIFTLAYSGAVDNDFLAEIVETVQSRQGSVYFVQLHTSDASLIARVSNEDRTALGKVDHPTHLKELLAERDLHATAPYPNILHIDTDTTSPEEATELTLSRFSLS
jgi:shikimate kinase